MSLQPCCPEFAPAILSLQPCCPEFATQDSHVSFCKTLHKSNEQYI